MSIVKTSNKMGHSITELTVFSRAFVDFCEGRKKVLDIGAGHGTAVRAALKAGATVIANDISQHHLNLIENSVPQNLKERLVLKLARVPDGHDLSDSSLDAIHISQVLHFMTGEEIEKTALLMHKWLKPQGKIFVIVGTPYVKMLENFIPTYEKRKKQGARWPGVVEDVSSYSSCPEVKEIPSYINFLDPDVLRSVFESAGFKVEECRFFERPNIPDYLAYDGRENVGLIASKA